MLEIKRVAIIGGAGQMGRWFSKFFMKQGCSVVISGRRMSQCLKAKREMGVDVAKTSREAIMNADLIVISVMVDRFEKAVQEIAPHIKEKQMVIDVTSVKQFPVRIMHRHIRHGTILGTHPMFGPTANVQGQNIILTPTNPRESALASRLGAYLKRKGFRITVMTPKEHDEMVGVILSLTHFVGFVTADTWKKLGIHRFMGTSSTSFRFLKSFVDSIVESSPELYSYLQVHIPNAHRAERLFVERSRVWSDLATRKKEKELVRMMSDLRSYLDRLD